MTEKEQKFHELYWLGASPNTFNDIASEMKITREEVSSLYESTKILREETKNKRAIWSKKFPDREISFGDFLDHFGDSAAKKCYYCGVTEKQLNQAIEQRIIWTKRSGRGPSLEMDRKCPNEPYSMIENIVFACYWCNNAKTDTFNEEEAKKIGKTIQNIWNEKFKAAGIEQIPDDNQTSQN